MRESRHEFGRLWCLSLSAVVAVSLHVAAEEGQKSRNLLRNGGFEDVHAAKGSPNHWVVADWSPANVRGTIALVSVDDDVAEGEAAAKIKYEGKGGNLVVYQDVKRRGSGSYMLKLKCLPPKGRWASASVVTLAKGTTVQYENTKRMTGKGQWHELKLAITTAKEIESIRVILRTNGDAVFDDVSLTETGRAASGEARGEPSTGRELKTKKAPSASYDVAADEARKAGMTPKELAWEKILEANLGSFYLPRYKQVKARGAETAWDYVKDDPKLPRVCLIGDSISRGYTVPARRALAGKANVHRAPANCGPTARGLQKLDEWLGDGKWDLIHFNFGIHDRNTKPDDYVERLEAIVKRLKATDAKVVWASSTPLSGKMIAKTGQDAMVRLNEVAASVMKKHGIPIDDLHAAATPILKTMQGTDGCHFNGQGYQVLGKTVAACILRELTTTDL